MMNRFPEIVVKYEIIKQYSPGHGILLILDPKTHFWQAWYS